jgi:hypothetical protein
MKNRRMRGDILRNLSTGKGFASLLQGVVETSIRRVNENRRFHLFGHEVACDGVDEERDQGRCRDKRGNLGEAAKGALESPMKLLITRKRRFDASSVNPIGQSTQLGVLYA